MSTLALACTLLAAGTLWSADESPPTATDQTYLDLGTMSNVRDHSRAILLQQMLNQMSIDARLSVSRANRLQLALPASENPIDPDRPQNAQIVALLANPWQVDVDQLDITTLGALLARIHERRGPLTPWHCVLLEQSLAKPLRRRLCRDRTGTVSLAATLLPDGRTRDWEVITEGKASDALEFYAFDPSGRRTLTADFGGLDGERRLPAPQSCAACHLDPALGAFKRWPTFADASVWGRQAAPLAHER